MSNHSPAVGNSSPLRLAFDLRNNVIDGHLREELLSFLSVVSLPQAELVEKPGRIHDADLPAKHADSGLGEIGQGNCCHLTIS
jgi:hypothetical protein